MGLFHIIVIISCNCESWDGLSQKKQVQAEQAEQVTFKEWFAQIDKPTSLSRQTPVLREGANKSKAKIQRQDRGRLGAQSDKGKRRDSETRQGGEANHCRGSERDSRGNDDELKVITHCGWNIDDLAAFMTVSGICILEEMWDIRRILIISTLFRGIRGSWRQFFYTGEQKGDLEGKGGGVMVNPEVQDFFSFFL